MNTGVRSELHPGGLAILILDSPQTLNALSLPMVRELRTCLQAWAHDPSVRAVVLRGEGAKSFCAGGDVKKVALSKLDMGSSYTRDFFFNEYTTDYLIHVYPKPILVLAHGLVLGGGLGLLSGAKIRVLSTDAQLGMPEILIGLYPDVGASYFLSRLPLGLGEFLGWTAARLNARSSVELGLADFLVPATHFPALIAGLQGSFASSPEKDAESLLLAEVARHAVPPETLQADALRSHLPEAIRIGQSQTPLEAARLLKAWAQSSDPWKASAATNFKAGSPTSAWLIQEQLRKGRTLSLGDCFRMEMNLSVQCFERGDFPEGVRARLIDKDLNPRWNPPTLDAVQAGFVRSLFDDCWGQGPHPLAHLEQALSAPRRS